MGDVLATHTMLYVSEEGRMVVSGLLLTSANGSD